MEKPVLTCVKSEVIPTIGVISLRSHQLDTGRQLMSVLMIITLRLIMKNVLMHVKKEGLVTFGAIKGQLLGAIVLQNSY